MNKLVVDISGQRFGMLVAIRPQGSARNGSVKWLCKCDCGEHRAIAGYALRGGRARSCGCKSCTKGTHNLSKSPEYKTWSRMRDRCERPANNRYYAYGARGIKVCDRWQDFSAFFADMGKRPSSNHSIDRINPNGNYEPSNCRWLEKNKQTRTKRNLVWVTIDGITKCLAEWCEIYGASYGRAQRRIRALGWDPAKALTEPPVKPSGMRHQ